MGIVGRLRRWHGGLVRPVFVAAALLVAVSLSPASAAEQSVTGTVAPQIGIGLDPGAASVGTAEATVSHELRGDVLYVTVVPAS